MSRVEMRIKNRMEDMPEIASMVERFCAQSGIPSAITNDLNLCLDEILCNIISYGYPEQGAGTITVKLNYGRGRLEAEIHDDGMAFDPLQAGPPDTSGTVQTRKIGGIGIHFVKELMDDIVYRRVGDENQLLLIKNIPG